ncbi:MAG: hypothetical protein DWQ36_22055 [Acidobacteria bacterium]|nr:MAG: hypothetical protein DWQ30_00485 [Acidobacteriota bacterium]REK00873.1 MAG: hypothetical protein DWQ36_22055 [Acidobacteriota bacterium]
MEAILYRLSFRVRTSEAQTLIHRPLSPIALFVAFAPVLTPGPSAASDRTEQARLTLPGAVQAQRQLGEAVVLRGASVTTDMRHAAGDFAMTWERGARHDWTHVDSNLTDGSSHAFASHGSHRAWLERPLGSTVRISDWVTDEILVPEFGGTARAIALGPDVMAVGYSPTTPQGWVDIFRYQGGAWVFEQNLQGGSFTGFGSSLAFNDAGTLLAVGAPSSGFFGDDNGEVRVYADQPAGWVLVQTVEPPAVFDQQTNAGFGFSIDIVGPWLAVGAPWADRQTAGQPQVDVGYVFIYEAVFLYGLHRSFFGGPGDRLGTSLAMARKTDGSYLLAAGAPYDSFWRGGADHGAIATYRWTRDSDEWAAGDRLLDSQAGTDDNLGTAVATDGTWIIAGVPSVDLLDGQGVLRANAGAVLVFLDDRIFGDGWESGNTSWWSSTSP